MANEIGNTELDVQIPEVWREPILEARYELAKALPRMLNVTGDVSERGDILHISVEPTVSVNDVGATGTLTNQALTPTEAQLTVNKWKEATGEVIDKAALQAIRSFIDNFPRAFGRALGQQMESDGLALESDVTQTSGDGTGDIGEDELTDAVAQLLNNKIPILEQPDMLTFAFHTSQWRSLKKEKVYQDAQITGMEGGRNKLSMPSVMGVPIVFTSQVASRNGERKNLLFHREAFAWGAQRNVTFEQLSRTKLTRVYVANALYGVKTVRANHAVAIRSKA